MRRRGLDVLELIELIYAAGLDPAQWSRVTDYLGGAHPFAAVAFQVVHDRTAGFSQANWESGALQSYGEHFIKLSPWVQIHRDARLGIPYHAVDTCPSATFRNTEFFHDWIRPYKVGCGAIAVKLLDDGRRFATLSMNYDERLTGRVKDSFTNLFSDLVPHLNRAIEMNRRLAGYETMTRTVEGLLHAIARPAFLLTADCRVIQMNERAEQSVRRGQGIYLGRSGHLHLEQHDQTERLRQVVAETANPDEARPSSSNGLLAFTVSGQTGPNLIFVFPMIAASEQPILRALQDSSRQVLAIIHFRQDAVIADEDKLRIAFGFTPAESRVVAALVAGTSLTDYSDQMSRSIHTVRLQLKHALAKAGCKTQADLIRIVLQTIGVPR